MIYFCQYFTKFKREVFRIEQENQLNFTKMNTNKKNVAFIISGAAAFIPQEIACIKAIVEATFPNAQEKINPTVISGTSSGSICTVLLNGVLAGKITWDQLENDIIPSIGNSSVFDNELFQKAILFSAINALTKTKGVIKDSEQLYNDIIVIFKDHKHLTLELFKQLRSAKISLLILMKSKNWS